MKFARPSQYKYIKSGTIEHGKTIELIFFIQFFHSLIYISADTNHDNYMYAYVCTCIYEGHSKSSKTNSKKKTL